MAKKTDITKIERIRRAAVSIMGREGVSSASVAAIARKAGVSVGYLYLHYPGKDALVNSLVESNFEQINDLIQSAIEEKRTLSHVTERVVRRILSLSAEDPEKLRFIIMLLNDVTTRLQTGLLERIDSLAGELLRMAETEDGARKGLMKSDIFFALVCVPMQYVTMSHNFVAKAGLGDEAGPDHIAKVALNVLFVH